MDIKTRALRHMLRLVGFTLAMASAACTLDKQTAPANMLSPSEFALSITATANPTQLPHDGRSQSIVTVIARDASGQPVAGQRIAVASNVGTVSQSEVVTGPDGRATFGFVAPPSDVSASGNQAIIQLTPIGGTTSSPAPRTLNIALSGISNSTPPSPAFTVTPAAPELLQNTVFDASGTTDEGVLCGDNCTYNWDFGGEAATTGRIANYQFRAVRTYAVRLTVTDLAGSRSSLTQNVTVVQGAAPTATFTFSPASPGQFETVFFTAEASRATAPGRAISTFQWNFGDGTSATGIATSHSYSTLGTFPVTLTVTDSAGVQGTITQNVPVGSGVTASFTFSPTDPRPNQDVFFDPESSRPAPGFAGRNPIVLYTWNFGDSTTVSTTDARIVSHQYRTVNAFTVVLTVEDSAGRRDTTSKTFSVFVH